MGRGESGRSWVNPPNPNPDPNVYTLYMHTAYVVHTKTAANFTFISGNIDVGDGCWGQNFLVTNFAC